MKKISISEAFTREHEKNQAKILLTPASESSLSSEASFILHKNIIELQNYKFLLDKLSPIIADAKLKFPFDFENIPLIYLLTHSKAKKYAFYISIISESGRSKKDIPILLLKRFEEGSEISYNYIDLTNGQVVFARGELAQRVKDGLNILKRKKAADLFEIADKGNKLARAADVMRNKQLIGIERGDVTNLISALPMLEKSIKLIDDRIKKFEGMVNFFEEEAKKRINEDGSMKPNRAFYEIYDKLDKEISSLSKKFIKSESDAVKALVTRYRGSPDQLEIDFKSGKLKNILSFNKISDDNKILDVITVAKKILNVFKEWDIQKRQDKLKKQEERKNKSKEPLIIDDSDPIFQALPPLTMEDFTEEVPGNIAGHQSQESYHASFVAKSLTIYHTKLQALKTMREGISMIHNEFMRQQKYGKLSVKNFNKTDIDNLSKAKDASLALISSYETSVVKKDGTIDKRKIGSVFEDAVFDLFLSRYIAIVIKYIIMVFSKSYS